ncbi:hypothetical protein ARD30_07725 [Bosea thiooxidans]|uniref:Uncharacterized protein n=1 Tax=Bosea thiooxidans TaxID=53254 RepID=A0A0Q3IBD6_9HYPH|nr:hypothetical protein ARD30_07725 [Bosea thiooxidans]
MHRLANQLPRHGTLAEGVIRVAFEEARFAGALNAHFGGVIAPADEFETQPMPRKSTCMAGLRADTPTREDRAQGRRRLVQIRRAARATAPGR